MNSWTLVMLLRGAIAAASLITISVSATSTPAVNVEGYSSLQEAIDANPGRILQLEAREYEINETLVIKGDLTELHGPARIIQHNPKAGLLLITGARGVRVSGIAFTRSEGNQETSEHGVHMLNCRDVELSGLRVSENHTHMSIIATDSSDITVRECTVINYKGITIDDRTDPRHLSGYAFKAIDGTGIQMRNVDGAVIRDNRIHEFRLLPTKEIHDRYDLGKLTIVPEKPGRLMSDEIFRTHYTNNWHQGSGIHVAGPDVTRRVLVTGNYIENAAQGIDIHADFVIVSSNIISHAMIGTKAMHGAKHVLIDGNQYTHVDLWGIKLMTGAGSRPSGRPLKDGGVTTENVDGGSIISNNIISNFGFGEQHWNWVNRKANRAAIILPTGQLEENPPLRNAIVTGNVVYDSGKDTVLVDGKWTVVPPRYNYALYVEQKGTPSPQNVKVYGNLLDQGLIATTNLTEGGEQGSR